jgi:predicted Rossmann fold flavoprotein
MIYDVIVVGGGAAGLMCAGTAGARGLRTLLLEHNKEVGAKIVISGGGRCNFTNLDISPSCFLSENPHFAKSALARFTQHDFIEMVERAGIAYYEKTLGQLFCDGDRSSRKIVSLLLNRCIESGVKVLCDTSASSVSRAEHFEVATSAGSFLGRGVVMASGGLAIPKLGASDFALRTAKEFGLEIVPPQPALVPLTFDGSEFEWMRELSGVSLPVTTKGPGPAFNEAMLFTHRGLSGPAILQISSYLEPETSFGVDLLAAAPAASPLLETKSLKPAQSAKSALAQLLPTRLCDALVARGFPTARLGDLKDHALQSIERELRNFRFTPTGTEGYAKAEVMGGGVSTRELSSKTMESSRAPGLYFIGEAVDVTGWLGGFNFQWAWSSGWVAGMSLPPSP